jgi:preprotein translocase subunit YajC
MFSFILAATAYAQTAAEVAPKGPSTLEMLILPIGFLFIMYFFMIRPQNKKAKEHQEMLTAIKVNDEVVTAGGLIGRVRSVSDEFISVDIASNCTVKVLKSHIASKK